MPDTTSAIASFLASKGISSDDYIKMESYVKKTLSYSSFVTDSFSNFEVNTNSINSSTSDFLYRDYFQFLSSIFTASDASLNDSKSLILPGIRYVSETLLVFERPPTLKPYSYKTVYREQVNEDSQEEEYYIPIPWQTYVCSFDPTTMRLLSVRMYFTNSSITSFENNVFTPPLLNFYSNGNLCRPFFESIDDVEKYPKNYTGIMASAYDWIWNSGTNFDITENISYFIKSDYYDQFKKYCTTGLPFLSYSFIDQIRMNNIPSTLSQKAVNAFFRCWSCVPLSDICSFEWNHPSSNDFYYMDQTQIDSSVYGAFLEENDFYIHESNSDAEEHDEDCPDDCIYEEEIFQLDEFSAFKDKYFQDALAEKTLRDVCAKAIMYLYQQGFYRMMSSQSSTNQVFTNAMKVIYSSQRA